MRLIFIFTLALIMGQYALAQEKKETLESFKPHSELAILLSHAEVCQGEDETGKKELLSLPAWGINYNYWLHPKWAIGIHTDIIVQKYEIKKTTSEGTTENFERSYPVAPALMGTFKPTRHWAFELGIGGEFPKKKILYSPAPVLSILQNCLKIGRYWAH